MATLDRTSPRVTYKAHCHCGRNKFTVAIPSLHSPYNPPANPPNPSPPADADPYPVISCNCSICLQNGYLNVYPLRTSLHFLSGGGPDSLSSYRFDPGKRVHYFCSTCGSSLYIDFAEVDRAIPGGGNVNEFVAVNVRAFKDIDLDTLKIERHDGRSLMPGEHVVEF